MDVIVKPLKRLSNEEFMFLNYGVGDYSWVPWTASRSNQSILKEINPWIFIRRSNAEAPILWPPEVKSQLDGKDPDDRLKEKGEGGNRVYNG